jgi:beta-ureidopropionase
MKNKPWVSRRNFLKTASVGVGGGIIGTSVLSCNRGITDKKNKLPREVCLVSIDLKELWPDTTTESRMKRILERMESIAGLQPDLLCLPELFSSIWVSEEKPLEEIAENEKVPGPIASVIAAFAKKYNCYIACPVYTQDNGHVFNSTLLIDRKGNISGVYHKIHPVKSEIVMDEDHQGGGVTPGALDQPIVKTDFGNIGMKICYDANWPDDWTNLKKNGAEIVLFSSAFPGGRILNYYAMKNSYYILSSTGGDARVVDLSGNDLDSSSTFVRYAWSYVNLEKAVTPAWPARDRLPELFKKYGNRLAIKDWDYTDNITIESRDPELKVSDVLKEFDIQSYDEIISTTEETQNKYRL